MLIMIKAGSLSLAGSIALGTGVMIGAGIFALLGQVAELSGTWFPYIFLLGAVISGFSAYSYIKVSNAYPSAGGIAMILQKAYGKSTITASAALIMALSMVINESLVARTFGSYTLQLFNVENKEVWIPILGVALLIGAFLIKISGNKLIGKSSQFMTFTKIAGIAIVAVGAAYLLHHYQYKKVAIIDYDVHHGNGTQEIFYNNPNVLYISTHQYPFYPGTGSVNEKGASNNILNIPLDPGTSSDIYFNSFENVLKKLKSFNPEFILLSSGFDAHQKDPLAQVNLKSKDFYEITKRIMNVADNICDGRIVSILEGGYDLNALKESAYEHVKALIEN